MGFEEFKKDFQNQYDSVYDFIDVIESPSEVEILGAKLEADLDEQSYDSYGSEDSTLRRVFHFERYGIYVEFYGNRSSYQGEEWYGYKEVTKKEKIISTWE